MLAEVNRAAMRDAGTVVWLRADPSVLAERVRNGVHRPLLADDPATVLRTLDADRRELYEAVSHHIVDTASQRPEDVVDAIVQALA